MNTENQKLLELTFYEDKTIAVLTLHAHTITIPLVRAINDILDELEKTTGPLCLITTSSHKKIYCAGLNFKVFDQHYEDVHNLIAELCRMFARFMELPFPTIAAINGHCLAGGFMFAMSHDLRIMNADLGKLGMTEINLGMTIPQNMMAPLYAKMSPMALREICLFGESLEGKRALEFGIVDKLVSGDKVLSTAMEIGKNLSTLAIHRVGYQGIKVSLYKKHIETAENAPRDIYAKTIIRRRQQNL